MKVPTSDPQHGFPLSREVVSGNAGKDGKVQKLLILLGLILLAIGLAWPWLRRLPLGRLPGDIHIVREGFSFSFPIVSCLIVSVVLSLILWFFRR